MKGSSLNKRFAYAIALFTVLILTLWFGYYIVVYQSVSKNTRENAEIVAERLIDYVSAEISQMRNIAGVIAASSYIQEFLTAETVEEYFDYAETASAFIRNAGFPVSSADSIITINAAGHFFRYIGGLSNQACEILYETVHDTGVFFTVTELDDTLFFCHSAPVYAAADNVRIGTVIILTNLHRKRGMLNVSESITGIETAVIQNNEILLSTDENLEGSTFDALENVYPMTVRRDVFGVDLSIAAVVNREVLFPNRELFLFSSLILLVSLIVLIIILYRYLSYAVKPIDKEMFEAELLKRDMQIGLLISQMDAHFVVNAIATIRALSKQGDNEKAERMADGLMRIIKHKHTGDTLCNVFLEFEMLQQYVAVMNIRHDNKFTTEYDVDDTLSAYLVPGLILQPIVENALTHGLQYKAENAVLHISGRIKDNALHLTISDNGFGINPEKLDEIKHALKTAEIENFPKPGLSGVSLYNIQRRIHLRFGSAYGISIESAFGKGTNVTIILPLTPDIKVS